MAHPAQPQYGRPGQPQYGYPVLLRLLDILRALLQISDTLALDLKVC